MMMEGGQRNTRHTTPCICTIEGRKKWEIQGGKEAHASPPMVLPTQRHTGIFSHRHRTLPFSLQAHTLTLADRTLIPLQHLIRSQPEDLSLNLTHPVDRAPSREPRPSYIAHSPNLCHAPPVFGHRKSLPRIAPSARSIKTLPLSALQVLLNFCFAFIAFCEGKRGKARKMWTFGVFSTFLLSFLLLAVVRRWCMHKAGGMWQNKAE